MDYFGIEIDKMSREALIDALCDGDEDEREALKGKHTETLKKELIKQIEDGAGDPYPNGRDYDAEDEDSL